MSVNTQEIAVLPAAVAAPAENVHIPSIPSVKGRFHVVADVEMDRIRAQAQRDRDEVHTVARQRIEEIQEREAADLAHWEAIAAFVEREVPDPTVRVGPAGRAPYTDAEISEAQEQALRGYLSRPLRSDDSEGRS